MEFDIGLGGAAIAGLLSFFSPCILPIVPFYLCFMAGLSMQELNEEQEIAPGARGRLILSSIFFALGVVTIFVLLGLAATTLGQLLRTYKEVISWVASGILLLFGLHFLGIFRIPLLYREAKIDSSSVKPASFIGSYLIGLAFGFGWTPCVGPALSAILYMATQQADIMQGALLLLTYGVFMTAPFVVAATFSGPFLGWVRRNRKYMGIVEKIMGAFLILFAILIVSGWVSHIANWLLETFPIFMNVG